MDQTAFNRIREIVYEQSGIRIADGKMSMVASRINKRLRSLSLNDELDYVRYLESSLSSEVVELLDVISTNVTYFFREPHHFEFVTKAMQGWLAEGQERFRFWSAASSTGEEPYTLAMTVNEAVRASGRMPDMRILATDICTSVLEHAQAGVYEGDKVLKVDDELRHRYFKQMKTDAGRYTVDKRLRDMILFKRMNLSKPPFPMRGPMDIIMCRNVMIYFDQPVRDALIAEFHRLLRPNGYLIVGHAESLTHCADTFNRCGPSTYQRIG